MEIKLIPPKSESEKATDFVKLWLLSRDVVHMEHDEEWGHFAQILAQCCNDYYRYRNDFNEIDKK